MKPLPWSAASTGLLGLLLLTVPGRAGPNIFTVDAKAPNALIIEIQAPALAPLSPPRRAKTARPRPKKKKKVRRGPGPRITSPVAVHDCIPAKLRPGTGARASLAAVGTSDRKAIALYVSGLDRMYCEGIIDDTAWAKVADAALAKYRPAIRLLANEVAARPDLIRRDPKPFVAAFEAEAKKRSSSPMAALGRLYELGIGVAADPAKARHWYEQAATQGQKLSLGRLAVIYGAGQGVRANPATAKKHIAALKHPEREAAAIAEIVIELVENAGPKDRIAEWNSFGMRSFPAFAAEMDRAFDLRMALLESADRDGKFLQTALEADLPSALRRAGRNMIESTDAARALKGVELLRRAAFADDIEAPRLLAQLVVDPARPSLSGPALEALKRAADANHAPALLSYADVMAFGAGRMDSKPGSEAAAVRAAAQTASASAQQRLAVMYLLGNDTKPSQEQAAIWLNRAAKNGFGLSGLILDSTVQAKAPTSR